MKLHDLFEAKAEPLNIDEELISLLKAHCSQNLKAFAKNGIPLFYRGMNVDDEHAGDCAYFKSDLLTTPRFSKTGMNIFLNWISISDDWTAIPNRQFSTFCTFSKLTSGYFGTTYAIIPFDNVESYAYTPADFNEMRINGSKVLDIGDRLFELRRIIANFIKNTNDQEFLKYKDNQILNKLFRSNWNLEEIEQLSNIIEELYRLCKENFFSREFINNDFEYFYAITKRKSLKDYLIEDFTPSKLKVETFSKLDEIQQVSPNKESEVWFTGRYVAIRNLGSIGYSRIISGLNKLVNE